VRRGQIRLVFARVTRQAGKSGLGLRPSVGGRKLPTQWSGRSPDTSGSRAANAPTGPKLVAGLSSCPRAALKLVCKVDRLTVSYLLRAQRPASRLGVRALQRAHEPGVSPAHANGRCSGVGGWPFAVNAPRRVGCAIGAWRQTGIPNGPGSRRKQVGNAKACKRLRRRRTEAIDLTALWRHTPPGALCPTVRGSRGAFKHVVYRAPRGALWIDCGVVYGAASTLLGGHDNAVADGTALVMMATLVLWRSRQFGLLWPWEASG